MKYYLHLQQKAFTLLFFLSFLNLSFAQENLVLKPDVYKRDYRVRSGVALGGLGTGSIELRKDGNFYNWAIFNNYPSGSGSILDLPVKPFSNDQNAFLFFLVRYKEEGKQPKIKLLQLTNGIDQGGLQDESPIYYFPWLTAIEKIEYSARFPFVTMKFTDSEMPFTVSLKAFSPFVPHNPDDSSIPAIYFDFTIDSKIETPIEVEIIATQRNLIAFDLGKKFFKTAIQKDTDYTFIKHDVGGVNQSHDTYGQMGLGALGNQDVSYYSGWAHRHPFMEKLLVSSTLENIDDTKNRNKTAPDGSLIAYTGKDNNQVLKSSVAITKTIPAGESVKANFFMTWYFPNAYGAIQRKANKKNNTLLTNEQGYEILLKKTEKVGKYYENNFKTIDEVNTYIIDNRKKLVHQTEKFATDFYNSSINVGILDQVNSQFNTLITSSQFDKAGRFAIQEGMTSNQAWGPFATTDVSLYGSVMLVSLFPELQKSMMKAHKTLQTDKGEINHGLSFDLGKNKNGTFGVYERVDLAPNYIQLVLRDYLFTNDKQYLKEMWPSVKLAIDYILKELDKDGDEMPDMHGIMCSYDNFPMYGLSSYIVSQWIAGLKMASIAAKDMNEDDLSKNYERIANKGISLMDKKLWNGTYFLLSNDYLGSKGKDKGCLTDQLFGQWVAHQAGLGRLFSQKKIKSALSTILDYSFIENTYLRNCTWPEYPLFYPMHDTNLWIDQANTPWTGVELAFAAFLIREDMVAEGEKIIEAVDKRYRRAGLYWDHQEFGGHYYRPMSAWSIIDALSGFTIVKDHYTFAPKTSDQQFSYFFSANTGTGSFIKNKSNTIKIVANQGELIIKSISLPTSLLPKEVSSKVIDNKGKEIKLKWTDSVKNPTMKTAIFLNEIHLASGEQIQIL
ncbi:hypothetical protein J8281_11870 [Aquimarina sp. U1-2]|uniref:GH116 family glycosyl hydrolase n=1 Tax=Aquimarina sp. U1-2 TaxID=2823141 RepID=UPI001AECB8C0|nr:GH116 family glycosyl hydrolase [Aquimarina sp. U1-2]MBP2832883.1 hypothetical protein [Aquimarina sp. U1-2]